MLSPLDGHPRGYFLMYFFLLEWHSRGKLGHPSGYIIMFTAVELGHPSVHHIFLHIGALHRALNHVLSNIGAAKKTLLLPLSPPVSLLNQYMCNI